MIMLELNQIKRLHEKMMNATGGLVGIKDESLLASALAVAFQTVDGKELYSSNIEKIARITYGIVSNHPFLDGNKRMGTYIMLTLLELNHIKAGFTDDDIIYIGLELASGKMNNKQLLKLILDRVSR
ncbi:MAG: Fic family protein [Spirochaetaceae bacterium]|nr:Fic family protein [Spirochaetaceae bacterium]